MGGTTRNHSHLPSLTFLFFLGHVLCLGCCEKIISKTSPRLSPTCPFCRDPFIRENVRVIRIDFNTSGHAALKRATLDAPDIVTDIFSRKDDLKLPEPITSRSPEDVRRLEQKVARVAAQKSSVEEVSMLYQELQAWLAAEPKGETQVCLRVAHQLVTWSDSHVSPCPQNTALQLSAALLRAILVNHVSHSEANKQSRSMELAVKERMDEMEASHNKLESELRR